MKYEVIEQYKSEYPVSRLCWVLKVSESGYYAWLQREPSQHTVQDRDLHEKIMTIWKQFRGIYGAPRIHAELLSQGNHVSRKRVARLMREADIQGKMVRRKRPCTTRADASHPVAPNLLNREFDVQQGHQVWLSDITYIDTEEGYLYLAGVLDLGSREIVGMAMADHLQTDLVIQALDMALIQQRPQPGLLHHSDRGSQYTSYLYQQKLQDAGLIASMSRTANCLDNAPMESFWATLKRECADHVFPNRDCARIEIFSYIMGFYNRTRRHSALNYHTPLSQAA